MSLWLQYQLPNNTVIQRHDLHTPDTSFTTATTPTGIDANAQDNQLASPDASPASTLPRVHYRKNARKDTDTSGYSSEKQIGPRNPDK